MKLLKYSLSSLLFVVLVGCTGGSNSPSIANANTDKLPTWYLNTQQSDNQYYYGVGEGSSKSEAKINALNQIASEISISISSSMEINKELSADSYSKKIQKNTKASVDKIKFTNVKIIENAQANSKIYSYVKVNRNTLFNAQKDLVDSKVDKVNLMWADIKANGIFKLIMNNKKLNNTIGDIYATLPILKAINSKFDKSDYINKLSKIDKDAKNMFSTASVYITGNKGSEPFVTVVKQHISSLGLNIVTTKQNVNNNDLLVIYVEKNAKKKNVKTSDPRLRGASFADMTIILKTLNASNKILAQNSIKVINISKNSYKDATAKTQKFERIIKKNGILNTLIKQ